jgi:monoamine oxidase
MTDLMGQIIFIGEHTTYTHSWISSALESGIRGAVQMLLGKLPPTRALPFLLEAYL